MLFNHCNEEQGSLLTLYKISYLLRIPTKKYETYLFKKCLLFYFIIINLPMKSKNILFSYLNFLNPSSKNLYI